MVTADTVVLFEGEVLGKPVSQEDARCVLGRLSGRVHDVVTSLCLYDFYKGQEVLARETTRIEFHRLSEQQIADYVASGEPMDKAGLLWNSG